MKGFKTREVAARTRLMQNAAPNEVRQSRAELLINIDIRIQIEVAEEAVARARAALEAAQLNRPEQAALDAAFSRLTELQAAAGNTEPVRTTKAV
jgi:hypothetical protein